MAIQEINIGNSANDGNGEPARSAFNKINQNFANSAHAASRMVGLEAGDVMQVGAFGLGVTTQSTSSGIDLNEANLPVGFYSGNNWTNAPIPASSNAWGYLIVQNLASEGASQYAQQIYIEGNSANNELWIRTRISTWRAWKKIYNTANTTTDSNGFIKAASPIVQLYSDKIELNDEAKEQSITFERVDVGHYLIKGSSGFATEGWYIEQPKDANGNLYHAVEIATHENGDLDVKTYDYMLDKKGRIVADYDTPLDIQEGRWIDIRLQEVPKPVPEMPTEEVNSDEPQQ